MLGQVMMVMEEEGTNGFERSGLHRLGFLGGEVEGERG